MTWARHHAAPLAGASVGIFALVVPLAVTRFTHSPFRLSEDLEIALKLALCLLATLVVGIDAWQGRRDGSRPVGFWLAAVASLGAAAYLNFGFLHGDGFVHHWEQFHYYLGSKYFPELGYDGLYVASIGAEADAYPDGVVSEHTRDLRTYQVEPVTSLFPHMREVWQRFEPDRWDAFIEDNRYFVDAGARSYLWAWRSDHGYNGSPSWTFVARLFGAWLPASEGALVGLGLLDLALLAGTFTLVFRTFGARVGCWSLVLLGFGYAGRFHWTGGAFLRHDWLAAVVIGVCMLQRARYRSAGALLGYAAMARVFPILFFAGPAILAVRALVRNERRCWIRPLVAGAAAAILLGLLAGASTGRGFGAWLEFSRTIQMHSSEWLTNNVGLEIPFLYDRDILERRHVVWTAPEPWIHVQSLVGQNREERRPWILASRLLFLAIWTLSIWRARLPEAALAGMAACFALTTPTSYYWIMLVALPLLRRADLVCGALALNLVAHAVHLLHPAFEMRFGIYSVGLALLHLAWLLPNAVEIAGVLLGRSSTSPALIGGDALESEAATRASCLFADGRPGPHAG